MSREQTILDCPRIGPRRMVCPNRCFLSAFASIQYQSRPLFVLEPILWQCREIRTPGSNRSSWQFRRRNGVNPKLFAAHCPCIIDDCMNSGATKALTSKLWTDSEPSQPAQMFGRSWVPVKPGYAHDFLVRSNEENLPKLQRRRSSADPAPVKHGEQKAVSEIIGEIFHDWEE